MQIPKIPMVICVLALGATLSVRAQDTPAQAAARAALISKLSELGDQPVTNPAPAAAQPAEAVTAEPPVVTADEKAQAAALVAAQKKADAAAAKAKAKAEKKAAALKAKQDAAAAAAAQAQSQADQQTLNDKQAAAMAALAAAQAAEPPVTTQPVANPAPMTVPAPVVAPAPMTAAAPVIVPGPVPAPAPAPAPVAAPAIPEMQLPGAPPLPISADKQQRLADLLVKYKADQITPEQYHTQRAAIIAEP
jgi:ribonuclease E